MKIISSSIKSAGDKLEMWLPLGDDFDTLLSQKTVSYSDTEVKHDKIKITLNGN